MSDERGRVAAWDSEAPATARDSHVERDSDFDRKESRTPLYIAGAVAVAVLGGLVLLASTVAGEPPLSPTVVTETVPRQAALNEKLDAQALDRARVAITGIAPTAPTSVETPSAPAAIESTTADPASVDPTSSQPTSIGPSTTGGMSVDPTSVQPSPAPSPAPDEAMTTPAPAPTTPPEIVLDRDNPYTSENEAPATGAPEPATQGGPAASDNPY